MSTQGSPGGEMQPAEKQGVAHEQQPVDRSRRAFLFKVSLFLNGIVGTILAVPILGYLFGPAVRRDASYRSWVSLGTIEEFPEGETRLANYRNPVTTASDGETANVACWVRRTQGTQFQVFAINCAHLGCPVRWFPQSRLFMCPCHGGAYYENGSRASGPPERGLFEYHYKVDRGHLMINAGEMPTLSNEACTQNRLTQIQAAAALAPQVIAETRSSRWPS
jgi:menaquinol-cytochrome c reductase iron-sulfur subunit